MERRRKIFINYFGSLIVRRVTIALSWRSKYAERNI